MENFSVNILIITITLLILLSAIRRKSIFLAILILLFMWSMCIFSTDAFDLRNMKYVYENYPYIMEEHAPGYDIFLRTCIGLGLSFTAFKAIIGAFSLIMLYITLKRSTKYFALVTGLYAIFPFLGTVTQIRNGMMAAIVMYSLICFILDPNHNIRKYVFGIVLACMFHWSAMFYLIFIIAKKKIKISTLFIVLILLVIIINIIITNDLLYPILSQFNINNRVIQWFNFKEILAWSSPEYYNWKSKALLVIAQIAGYVIFYMVFRNYKRCIRKSRYILPPVVMRQRHYFSEETLDFINRIEILLFCIVPLYMLTPTFFRIYKNVILLIYIVTAQYYSLSAQSDNRISTARRLCLGLFLYAFFIGYIFDFMQGEGIMIINSYLAGIWSSLL